MTEQLTIQLGIEFERRLHEIYPMFKQEEKLDTDTIYSFLSEYLMQYVKLLCLLQDLTVRDTRANKRVSDILKALTIHRTINDGTLSNEYTRCYKFSIPKDYMYYIRSNSIINKNYKSLNQLVTNVYTPNITIKEEDAQRIGNTYFNKGAIIRRPMVLLESTLVNSPEIKVVCDEYTDIQGLELVYIYKPHSFNILNYGEPFSEATHEYKEDVISYCELPFECFDELVQGAIDLYVSNYKFKLLNTGNNRRRRALQLLLNQELQGGE